MLAQSQQLFLSFLGRGWGRRRPAGREERCLGKVGTGRELLWAERAALSWGRTGYAKARLLPNRKPSAVLSPRGLPGPGTHSSAAMRPLLRTEGHPALYGQGCRRRGGCSVPGRPAPPESPAAAHGEVTKQPLVGRVPAWLVPGTQG